MHLVSRPSSLNSRHNLLVVGCSGQHNLKLRLPQALGLHLVRQKFILGHRLILILFHYSGGSGANKSIFGGQTSNQPTTGFGSFGNTQPQTQQQPPQQTSLFGGGGLFGGTTQPQSQNTQQPAPTSCMPKISNKRCTLTDYLFSIRRGSNSWPDYRHRTLWWRGPVRQHDWSTAAAATHTATTFPARWIRTIRRQQTRGACWVFVWGRSKSTAGDRCTTTRAFRWFHAWPNQPFTVDVGRRVVW